MAIAVADKGSASAYSDFAPINQIVHTGVSIVQGASVIVVIAADDSFGVVGAASWNGQALTLDNERENAGDTRIVVASLHGVNAGTGQVVVSMANSVQSAGLAIGVIQATGLLTASVLDRTAAADGSSATPSSGATAATTVADELLIGAVAMASQSGVGGSWDGSFAGMHALNTSGGTDDVSLSTAYRIVSATGAYTASKSGATNAPWAAIIATYKSNVTTHSLAGAASLVLSLAGSLVAPSLAGAASMSINAAGSMVNNLLLHGAASLSLSAAAVVDVVGSTEYRRRGIGAGDYRVRVPAAADYRVRSAQGTDFRVRDVPVAGEQEAP